MRTPARALGVVLGAGLLASGGVAVADPQPTVSVRQTPAGLAQSVDSPRPIPIISPHTQVPRAVVMLDAVRFPKPVRTPAVTASLRKIKPIRVGADGRGLAYTGKF